MRRPPLLLLALIAAAAPLRADDPGAETFGLWFGGLKAGEVSVVTEAAGGRWSLEAEGRPADWLSALYSARLTAEGEGPAGEAGPRPGRFLADLAFGDDRQRVEVRRGPDGVPEVRAEPEFRPRPWQIDPAAQGDAEDPTSLAAALLAPTPPEALCARETEIFDGRRRSRVTLGAPTPDAAGLWRCEGEWERVAGYRAKHLERAPVPVEAVFAEGGDGLARLVRVEVRTGWGVAVAAR
jgi:hypothetical protein